MPDDKRLPIRHLRAADGIVLGTLLGTVVFCHPALGRTVLGAMGNRHMLPIVGAVIATWFLPVPDIATDVWRTTAWRLKFAALLVVGLGPFVSWWLRHAESLYLLLAASTGIAAAFWYLVELAVLIREMSHACRDRQLYLESRLARLAVVYLLVIPALAVYAAFTTALLTNPITMIADLPRTWTLIPPPFRVIMPLPVLYLCWLLWRAQGLVVQALSAQRETLPENPP